MHDLKRKSAFALRAVMRLLNAAHHEPFGSLMPAIGALEDRLAHFGVDLAAADHNPADLNEFMNILFIINQS